MVNVRITNTCNDTMISECGNYLPVTSNFFFVLNDKFDLNRTNFHHKQKQPFDITATYLRINQFSTVF